MLTRAHVGFLDFGIRAGLSTTELVNSVIERAQLAETLGFGRYWLGEHYEDVCGWYTPEVMMAYVCAHTRQIRVGSGATLPLMRRPQLIAKQYALLHARYGERVELGLGAGRGTPDVWQVIAETYPEAVEQIVALVPTQLDTWVLGSSANTLELAGRHGLRLCLGMFLSQPEEAVLTACRERRAMRGLGVAIAGVLSPQPDTPPNPQIQVVSNFRGPGEAAALIERLAVDIHPDHVLVLDLTDDNEQRLAGVRALAEFLPVARPRVCG